MRENLRRLCPSLRNEAGSVSVEFAAIAIALVIMTLGAFDLARALFTQHRLTSAVGAASRMIQMQSPNDAVATSVSSRFSPDEQRFLTIEVDPNYIGENGIVYTRVDAWYDLPIIVPNLNLFPESIYTLHALQLIPAN